MLYDLMSRHGIKLVEDQRLRPQLWFTEYPPSVGQRVKIHYLLEDHLYSKSLREKITTNGQVLKAVMDQTILEHVGSKPFLLLANKDDNGPLAHASNSIRLPHNLEGLNCYDDKSTVVLMAALNRTTMHLKLLVAAGFQKATVRHSTMIEKFHQAVMRTSLRRPESTCHIEIIIPDRTSAIELGRTFGCENALRLGHIELQPPEPKHEPLTKTEINQRAIFKKLKGDLLNSRDQSKSGQPAFIREECPEIDNKKIQGGNSHRFLLTFPASLQATKPQDFSVKEFNLPDMIKLFKSAGRTVTGNKEEHLLFCMSCFQSANGDAGLRSIANFEAAYGLVLDFDGGDLGPEDFAIMFWDGSGQLSKMPFMIANTFSRSEADPNRFRVIIPFRTPATTLNTIHAVYDDIEHRIESYGFCPKDKPVEGLLCSGLDRISRSGVQQFWLPCTNQFNREYAFFETFGLSAKEFEDHGFDPTGYQVTHPRR